LKSLFSVAGASGKGGNFIETMITKAKRPKFSALRSIKLPKYGIKIREWKEALNDYLIEKGHIRQSDENPNTTLNKP
jgi:dTDP-4-dehydrorhamnose reductase